MSESKDTGGIFRAIGWLGVGLLVALAGVAAMTPAGAYDFAVIAPMLGIIVVGTAVTLYAGFKGQRVAQEHRQLRRMQDADEAAGDHTPSDPTDHGQDD